MSKIKCPICGQEHRKGKVSMNIRDIGIYIESLNIYIRIYHGEIFIDKVVEIDKYKFQKLKYGIYVKIN